MTLAPVRFAISNFCESHREPVVTAQRYHWYIGTGKLDADRTWQPVTDGSVTAVCNIRSPGLNNFEEEPRTNVKRILHLQQ